MKDNVNELFPAHSFHYKEKSTLRNVVRSIIDYLPDRYQRIVVLCIGSDRSTGDALGPLTGMYLSKYAPKIFTTYGTLHKPIHALNLEETIDYIEKSYDNPFVIAIDASLGKLNSIGHIIVQK